MRKLEVIVLNAEDSVAAQKAGADRLELVSAMEVGGLSPDIETINQVVAAVNIPVNVMVRFKSEDFVYNHEEFAKLKSYIKQIKSLGINGIVFGSLNSDGSINENQLAEIKQIGSNLDLTFHRAIDESSINYQQNMQIIDGIATTVLTSGGLEKPIDENICHLLENSDRTTRILAGGGITKENYNQLFRALPNVDFHVGSLAYNNGDFTKGINRQMVEQLKRDLNA